MHHEGGIMRSHLRLKAGSAPSTASGAAAALSVSPCASPDPNPFGPPTPTHRRHTGDRNPNGTTGTTGNSTNINININTNIDTNTETETSASAVTVAHPIIRGARGSTPATETVRLPSQLLTDSRRSSRSSLHVSTGVQVLASEQEEPGFVLVHAAPESASREGQPCGSPFAQIALDDGERSQVSTRSHCSTHSAGSWIVLATTM